MSDSEVNKHVPGSGLHTASVAATAITGNHPLSSRSVDSAVSRSDTDAVPRTAGGKAAELPSSTAQSPYQCQQKADEPKRKPMRRVRTTRCHKCVNCLAPDCGKCHSCRSVLVTEWILVYTAVQSIFKLLITH